MMTIGWDSVVMMPKDCWREELFNREILDKPTLIQHLIAC